MDLNEAIESLIRERKEIDAMIQKLEAIAALRKEPRGRERSPDAEKPGNPDDPPRARRVRRAGGLEAEASYPAHSPRPS